MEIRKEAARLLIRIPAAKNYFVMFFLLFWVCGWTVGGFFALSAVFEEFNPFLLFWLGGWALGELFVLSTLV